MRIDLVLKRGILPAGLAGAAVVGIAAVMTVGSVPTPEPDAMPATPLESTPTPSLPFEVNDRVEYWIERYQAEERVTFELYLERRGLYESMIRGKLRARGMPEELIYLAMIESGFAPDAVSPVAATGVWQFMARTARAEGLRVDTWVDERRDPVLATDAALDYLERLHDRFGSWTLAAAAYNAGPTRVARVLRRNKAQDRSDERVYWDVIEALPRETRAYVPKLLAARILAESPQRFGFHVETTAAYTYDLVMVPGGTWLTQVARSLDVPSSTVRELNPHFLRGRTPPGTAYPVRVPVGGSRLVVAYLNMPAGREPTAD